MYLSQFVLQLLPFPALSYIYFLGFEVFVSVCCCRCHASHIMSSCVLHFHTCSSHAFEHFPRCPFCILALPHAPAHPSCLFSCAGVERSRNGPRLAKRPWYSTGRPPVKFRDIWRSFDTPTVNRVTAKSFSVLQKKPPPNSSKPT